MWCVSVGVGVWLCMCVYVRATIARHLVADAAAQPSDAALHVYVYMGTRARVKGQSTDGFIYILHTVMQ